jgi:hypothetical protein
MSFDFQTGWRIYDLIFPFSITFISFSCKSDDRSIGPPNHARFKDPSVSSRFGKMKSSACFGVVRRDLPFEAEIHNTFYNNITNTGQFESNPFSTKQNAGFGSPQGSVERNFGKPYSFQSKCE